MACGLLGGAAQMRRAFKRRWRAICPE